MFGSEFQDQTLLADVVAAINFKDFWMFMRVFYDVVINHLEGGATLRYGLFFLLSTAKA